MMSFKELAVSMQSDMIAQSKAHQRIEERKLIAMNDADVDDDRHDSDAEGHRQESAELRDYSFLRDGND
tara:strand:- start:127 stop:333 length:207 start_codon:yes stop_codon:yes gene_type:complete